MKRRLIAIIFIAATTLSACVRQNLEEIYRTKAIYPVIIDWESKALMDVNNDPEEDLYSASLWLFPTENSAYQGEPMEFKLANPEYDYIEIPIGEYNVLAFNKTIDDYSDRVYFRGTDSYETFEYVINPTPLSTIFKLSKGSTNECLAYPDLLAAWRFEDGETLKVTFDDISRYDVVVENRELLSHRASTSTKVTAADLDGLGEELLQLTHIVPERLVHNVTIHESVVNMHSAKRAHVQLTGVSNSVLLASKSYSSSTVSHATDLTEREWDEGSKKNGVMRGSFNVIGPTPVPGQYSVESMFTLAIPYEDSYYFPVPSMSPLFFDVTEQVENQEIGLDKHIDIYVGPCELPDLIITDDSGFNIEVNDWEDETVIPM